MKVGILGSRRRGSDACRGIRKPRPPDDDWDKRSGKAVGVAGKERESSRSGNFSDAATFGEVLVLAVKGSAAADVLKAAGSVIDGKLVMDACNPIADAPPVNGVLKFFTVSTSR